MIVEAAIGDAFGAGREYAPPADVAANNDGKTYVQHQKWKALTPGKYTDDTQMMVALAEFMLSGKAPTAVNLWTHFLHAFKRDPRAGYAGKFYEILQKVNNVDELMRKVQPQSDRSGGAMRAAPCGMLPTVSAAIDYAMWQASLTHATKDGMGAAAGAAALVWACRQGCDRGYLPQFLEDVLPGFRWTTPWTGPVGHPGLESVKAALAAVVDNGTMAGALRQSIAYTGDVDTVATIAMAAASVHPDVPNDLAQQLYDGLEPGGKYGFAFLHGLDARLETKFPLVKPKPDEDDAPTGTVPLVEGPSPEGDVADLFDFFEDKT